MVRRLTVASYWPQRPVTRHATGWLRANDHRLASVEIGTYKGPNSTLATIPGRRAVAGSAHAVEDDALAPESGVKTSASGGHTGASRSSLGRKRSGFADVNSDPEGASEA